MLNDNQWQMCVHNYTQECYSCICMYLSSSKFLLDLVLSVNAYLYIVMSAFQGFLLIKKQLQEHILYVKNVKKWFCTVVECIIFITADTECACMCTRVYPYVCVKCVCACMRMFMCLSFYVCLCVYRHVSVCVCPCVYICGYAPVPVCVCTCICVYMYVCTCMCVYVTACT